MGCLFAVMAGFFPRFGLFILWVARPAMVDAAFGGWIFPILGIIFLPFTTLIYVVLYTPRVGVTGWDWLWIGLAALCDISHWAASVSRRNQLLNRQVHSVDLAP
jgi:hypothetical protein